MNPASQLLRLAVLGILVSACTLGPDYQRPEVDLPEDFNEKLNEAEAGKSLADLRWWELFNDDELIELVDTAIAENNNLAIATARLEEARARLGFVRADQFPFVDGAAGASRGSSLARVLPGAGVQNNYVLAADVSYEVDLFGKLRRSTEAARAELLASEEARRTVLTTLIADVASNYFLLRDLDDRAEIARRTLETRADSTQIIRARFEKGTVPMLDVNQAEIEEADAAAALAAVTRQRILTENVISVLIGRKAGPITRGRSLEEQLQVPEVPAGLPSQLLDRRPDVRTSEARLAAQTARIGVAEALRYPSLSLTGTLGLASNDLSDLTDGASEFWDVSASLFAPVFNSGQNKRRVEIEVARTEQAMEAYEFTVLLALREVEDALASVRTLRDEFSARERQFLAARSAATLSRARYDGGVSSYLEVLDSERSLFQAENFVSIVRRNQLVTIVELYKALGGGWVPDPQ